MRGLLNLKRWTVRLSIKADTLPKLDTDDAPNDMAWCLYDYRPVKPDLIVGGAATEVTSRRDRIIIRVIVTAPTANDAKRKAINAYEDEGVEILVSSPPSAKMYKEVAR
jgi:hypothetical protein